VEKWTLKQVQGDVAVLMLQRGIANRAGA